MSGIHAEWAPSSMYLTVACPGWRDQTALMPPEPETEATREGEAGHWVAAVYASGTPSLPPVGWHAPNGVEVDEEMLDGAALWVEALEGFPAHIETPVAIPYIHPTKCWGTPDARQWNAATKTLRVADYKYGHEFVDEFENWQMLAYAVGIITELGVFDDPDVKIEMTVVQPRFYNAEPIRSWTIQTQGLHHYAERMRLAVREAEGNSPRVISGTHCTHCPARATCKVFAKTSMHAVDFTGRPDPMLSRPEDVGRELQLVQAFIERLKARENGLAAMAEAFLRAGKSVPHFMLEQGTGREAWTVPVEVVELSANMVGKSALKPPALITPNQARQRKVLDTRVIAAYSERPKGSLKLTPVTTKLARKFTT